VLTQAVKPDIGSESRFLPTPPAFDARDALGGFPSEYCYAVCTEKPSKVKKFEDMFIRFDMIYERDGQTDRQTSHDS